MSVYADESEATNAGNALWEVAHALQRLGVGNADTQMGGLEVLAVSVAEAGERIADALSEIAAAIRGDEA